MISSHMIQQVYPSEFLKTLATNTVNYLRNHFLAACVAGFSLVRAKSFGTGAANPCEGWGYGKIGYIHAKIGIDGDK